MAKDGGAARVGRWLGEQVEIPERRELWIEVVWKLAVVVAAGGSSHGRSALPRWRGRGAVSKRATR